MKTIVLMNQGFGDAIWAEPIIDWFVRKGHLVRLVTKHSCIFDHHPGQVHCGHLLNFSPLPLDTIYLSHTRYPKQHILETYRMQAGLSDMPLRTPTLYLSAEEQRRDIHERYALLHLDRYDAHRLYRNAYGIDWEQVVSFLRSLGLAPLQISQSQRDCIVPWVPTSDFRKVMSLMRHAELFIGLDSGPSHIAACMNIPSVLFFGSVNPLYRHLNLANKAFLQSDCPFAHCYHEVSGGGQPCKRVPAGEPPPCCIHDADRVIRAVRSLLCKKIDA